MTIELPFTFEYQTDHHSGSCGYRYVQTVVVEPTTSGVTISSGDGLTNEDSLTVSSSAPIGGDLKLKFTGTWTIGKSTNTSIT